jgi:hypothetical protein
VSDDLWAAVVDAKGLRGGPLDIFGYTQERRPSPPVARDGQVVTSPGGDVTKVSRPQGIARQRLEFHDVEHLVCGSDRRRLANRAKAASSRPSSTLRDRNQHGESANQSNLNLPQIQVRRIEACQ